MDDPSLLMYRVGRKHKIAEHLGAVVLAAMFGSAAGSLIEEGVSRLQGQKHDSLSYAVASVGFALSARAGWSLGKKAGLRMGYYVFVINEMHRMSYDAKRDDTTPRQPDDV